MMKGTGTYEDGITSIDILFLPNFVKSCQLAKRLEVVM
jgi:hypothetical protein